LAKGFSLLVKKGFSFLLDQVEDFFTRGRKIFEGFSLDEGIFSLG
jgi:hypothetical protein